MFAEVQEVPKSRKKKPECSSLNTDNLFLFRMKKRSFPYFILFPAVSGCEFIVWTGLMMTAIRCNYGRNQETAVKSKKPHTKSAFYVRKSIKMTVPVSVVFFYIFFSRVPGFPGITEPFFPFPGNQKKSGICSSIVSTHRCMEYIGVAVAVGAVRQKWP